MPPNRRFHRVAILTSRLAHGGADAQVVLLAVGLKRRGWDVAVMSLLPPQAHVEELEQAGISVACLGAWRGVPDPRAIWRLAAHWRSFRPHVVHCHMMHANFLGRITRLIAPVPVLISTAHGV